MYFFAREKSLSEDFREKQLQGSEDIIKSYIDENVCNFIFMLIRFLLKDLCIISEF